MSSHSVRYGIEGGQGLEIGEPENTERQVKLCVVVERSACHRSFGKLV